jgi:hypothetical protein
MDQGCLYVFMKTTDCTLKICAFQSIEILPQKIY